MKSQLLKGFILVVVMGGIVFNAEAQRRRTSRSKPTTNEQQQSNPQDQQNNNVQQPKYNPYGNIPIEVAPSSGGIDTIRRSQRNDGAVEQTTFMERTPLPYEYLRADDALYTERVWRELDLREKMNMPFRYKAEDDNGDLRFISILLNAVKSGKVIAFDANVDDRFTTPLDTAQVKLLISGGEPDTVAVYGDLSDPTKITKYRVVTKEFNPDDVMKIRIKEEWVFDREASRMFVRILGIAPLKTLYRQDGSERGTTPMFWVYYPDLRPILAKYEVYNPKNMGVSRMTWEELFETRMFSSYIIKSTLDNPLNKQIRQYIKDPILALLEGDAIKDKIFNYEQDLWSY